MDRFRICIGMTMALLVAASAVALNPGTDVFVPAAGHAPGSGSSLWITDLFVYNPDSVTATVTVAWLPRGGDNSSPATATFDLAPGATLVLDDVVLDTFGVDGTFGALRVTSASALVVTSRVYNDQGAAGTLGQGFEGIPVSAALAAGDTTEMPGLAEGTGFRSNFGAVETAGTGSTVRFTLLDTAGATVATRDYDLEPYEPILPGITELGGGDFADGTLRAEVVSGQAIVFASKVDNTSGDATTLEAWWQGGGGAAGEGTYQLAIYDSALFAAGGYMTVAGGQVTALVGTYFNWDKVDDQQQSECQWLFPFGDLISAVDVTEFASGYTWQETYTDLGTITWTLTFAMGSDGTSFEGTMEATGSDFPDGDPALAGCNGEFPTLTIRGGFSR